MTLRHGVPKDNTKYMFQNRHDRKRQMFGIFMLVKLWKMSALQYFLTAKRLFTGRNFENADSTFVGIYMDKKII